MRRWKSTTIRAATGNAMPAGAGAGPPGGAARRLRDPTGYRQCPRACHRGALYTDHVSPSRPEGTLKNTVAAGVRVKLSAIRPRNHRRANLWASVASSTKKTGYRASASWATHWSGWSRRSRGRSFVPCWSRSTNGTQIQCGSQTVRCPVDVQDPDPADTL